MSSYEGPAEAGPHIRSNVGSAFRRIATFALACACVSYAHVSAQTPATASWPQFRGNHRLTGIAESAPPDSPKLLWKFEAGEAIDSSPAIVDGVVYVGAFNGDLVAVDLATGKLRWKYAAGSAIGESSPAVAGETVFIGDSAGVVHAVRTRDGSGLWTFKTQQEIKSSPVVVGAIVLIGSYDGFLYALETASGRLTWKFETDGPVHATPAVHNGVVFVAGCDESLRAFNVADGAELYRIPAGANTAASPVVDGDRAYVGTFNSEVLAFDLKAKTIVWRYENPDRQFPFYSSAALVGGRVIVGSRDKLVHAIDAKTGKAAWTFTTQARVDSSPAVAGSRVYIGSSDGRLYGLNAATGRKEWEFDAGAPLTSSPAIASGRIVIGSTDGALYCFG
jgi:outer membrane protein assembly factor BamB